MSLSLVYLSGLLPLVFDQNNCCSFTSACCINNTSRSSLFNYDIIIIFGTNCEARAVIAHSV
jgi:hypothetical protein